MTDTISNASAATTRFHASAAAVTSAEILREALECCIGGRPLPASLTPPAAVANPQVRPFSEWL